MISIDDALKLISQSVSALEPRSIALSESVGCTLAEPVIADVDSPPHTKSVMDGFAVRAEDVAQDCKLSVIETIIAGDNPTKKITPGTAARIMTGAPLPVGADSVVMVEQTKVIEGSGETLVQIKLDSLDAGRHTMQRAASFSVGELIINAGHTIRPLDVGLLAEVGAATVNVYPKPNATVLPTGNELVDASVKPAAGQIRNSNGPMLEALLNDAGAVVTNLGIGRDDPDDLGKKLKAGLESDLLILSGGVSAGTMDLVPKLLQEAGVEQIFHKVKVKPGKPIWFGKRTRGNRPTYVFGLPGNPVSSLVGFELFAKAAIRKLCGAVELRPESVFAELAEPHEARGDRPTYWPGCWVRSDEQKRLVRPLRWLGSSDLRALGSANALIFFPADRHEYMAGEKVAVVPICRRF